MAPSLQVVLPERLPVVFQIKVPIRIESEGHGTGLSLQPNRLALLTIAACSIMVAQWFSKEDMEFRIQKEKPFIEVSVQLAVRPDLDVEGLIQQLRQQWSPEKQSSLCKSYHCKDRQLNINLLPRFSIFHDMGKNRHEIACCGNLLKVS